jgi:hypothetical protein
MDTVRLRNVHPLGDVDLPALGRVDAACVKAGEEFDCPAELAGELPGTWREPTEQERAEGLRGLAVRETGRAPHVRTEVLSPGVGLLGTRNFEIVPAEVSGETAAPSPAPEA